MSQRGQNEEFSPQNNGVELQDEDDREVSQRMEEEMQTPTTRDPNEPKSLFCATNMKVAQVNALIGTLNGFSVGFVGVYSTCYGYASNCILYKAEKSCQTVPFAKCTWYADSTTGEHYCGWTSKTCAKLYNNTASCDADKDCSWSYSSKACQNPSGLDASKSGIFAGAMIVGCFFGSFIGGPLSRRIGPKLVFLIVGIVSTVCSVLYHISIAVDQFWVLCVFRLIIGVFLGICCVAAPMYVAENAHPKYAKMIGVMFQVFTTLGIFLASMMGLAMGQSIRYADNSNQNLIGRLQGLCVLSTLLSLLVMAMGIYLPGSFKVPKKVKKGEQYDANGEEGEEAEERELSDDEKKYSCAQMIGPLLMGFIVAGTLQLTGINAIMNYAPTIMSSLGLAPLVGNIVVMAWNFVTTIFSVPLASVFTMRQLFLACSLITSVMCLFLCGIPVYPGVTKKAEAKNGVAIAGILIFIGAFEMGVGPCFYVLAQDLFPKSFRATGASVTNVIQFVFNVVINVCYPIATERISGGPSGNQDKGQAIAFIFFGGIGLICFFFQCIFLKPWDETHKVTASAPEVEHHSDMGGAEHNSEMGGAPDEGRKDEKPIAPEDIKVAVAKNPKK